MPTLAPSTKIFPPAARRGLVLVDDRLRNRPARQAVRLPATYVRGLTQIWSRVGLTRQEDAIILKASPDRSHGVRLHGAVPRHEVEILRDRLRNEHPIERIGVQFGKLAQRRHMTL